LPAGVLLSGGAPVAENRRPSNDGIETTASNPRLRTADSNGGFERRIRTAASNGARHTDPPAHKSRLLGR